MNLIYKAELNQSWDISHSWEWIPKPFRRYNKKYFSKSPETKAEKNQKQQQRINKKLLRQQQNHEQRLKQQLKDQNQEFNHTVRNFTKEQENQKNKQNQNQFVENALLKNPHPYVTSQNANQNNKNLFLFTKSPHKIKTQQIKKNNHYNNIDKTPWEKIPLYETEENKQKKGKIPENLDQLEHIEGLQFQGKTNIFENQKKIPSPIYKNHKNEDSAIFNFEQNESNISLLNYGIFNENDFKNLQDKEMEFQKYQKRQKQIEMEIQKQQHQLELQQLASKQKQKQQKTVKFENNLKIVKVKNDELKLQQQAKLLKQERKEQINALEPENLKKKSINKQNQSSQKCSNSNNILEALKDTNSQVQQDSSFDLDFKSNKNEGDNKEKDKKNYKKNKQITSKTAQLMNNFLTQLDDQIGDFEFEEIDSDEQNNNHQENTSITENKQNQSENIFFAVESVDKGDQALQNKNNQQNQSFKTGKNSIQQRQASSQNQKKKNSNSQSIYSDNHLNSQEQKIKNSNINQVNQISQNSENSINKQKISQQQQKQSKQPKKQKKEVTDFKIYFNQKDEFDYKIFASDVENDIKLENKLKIQEEIKQHNERFNQKIEQIKYKPKDHIPYKQSNQKNQQILDKFSKKLNKLKAGLNQYKQEQAQFENDSVFENINLKQKALKNFYTETVIKNNKKTQKKQNNTNYETNSKTKISEENLQLKIQNLRLNELETQDSSQDNQKEHPFL